MSIPFLSGFGLDDGRARLAALDRSLATIAFSLDGVIVDANENFLTTTGYAIDEIRGRHHRMFMRPEDAQSADYEAFWGRLRDGGTESGEFQRVGAGGRAVWLQASYTPVFDRRGRPAGVVKIAIDVTAQKTLDADRIEQLAAIDRSQAVIEFDLEGRILRANDNFLQAAGYRLDEIVGRPHAMFVDPEEAAGAPYRAFWQALARGEPQAGEFRRKRRDGRDLWLQAVYSPIRDAGGVCRKVVKYASDVTVEKENRADAESQLAAVNRAQAVIQFDVEGRVLDANENFLTAVGYSMREIAGQHHAMFVEPSHAQSADYAEFWAKLRRGELVAGMFQRMAKSGRPIWIQASYNPVFGPGGELVKIVKFATDVTGSMGARQTAVSTAEQALDNVEQISHAAEGLKAAADDITTSMSRSREAVDEIERRSREAVTMTGRLSDAARSMDGVVAAISTIASQINLLSLNATIEAARAGEAGRGFTVVAAEVKNLADQAATATARIGVEIAGVQGVSSEVVGQLAAIAGSVDQISVNVGEVAALVDEQGRSTADMLVNVRQAAASFSSIATSLDEWTVGIEERRSEKRTRVLYAATIQAAGGREISCIVRDISAGGARIELRSLESLPPVFVLALEGDGRRMSCELKVQDGLEARVRFTGAASRAA